MSTVFRLSARVGYRHPKFVNLGSHPIGQYKSIEEFVASSEFRPIIQERAKSHGCNPDCILIRYKKTDMPVKVSL